LSGFNKKKKKKLLNICYLNALSTKNKTIALHDYIVTNNFDVVAITETWLGTSQDKKCKREMVPEGYDIEHIPRQTKQPGGGVAVIFKLGISINITGSTKDKSFTHFEFMDCKLGVKGGFQFVLSVVYRPPPSRENGFKDSIFFKEWASYILRHATNPSETLIVGDVNYHLDVPDDADTRKFITILDSCGLKQHVDKPTHKKGHTLDVLITKDTSLFATNISVSDPCLFNNHGKPSGDHFAITFDVSTQKPSAVQKHVSYRKFRDINVDAFKEDVKSTIINIKEESVDNLLEAFNTGLKDLINVHAPLCHRAITLRPNAPWYSDELRMAKRQKRKLERQWHKSKLEVHRLIYRDYCCTVNKLLIKTRSDYYLGKIVECGRDQKGIYRIAKHLLGEKMSSILPDHLVAEDLANRFQDYFTEKIILIFKSISPNYPLEALTTPALREVTSNPNVELTAFEPTTNKEVRGIIMSSSTTSCDLDPIPTWLLKQCTQELLPAITNIVNASLLTGEVPKDFKFAHVRPLLKKTGLDQNILKNYRPVSNLSFLSKILEKVVAVRLDKHMDTHTLREKFQSAYTKSHSTETALLRVQTDILQVLDSGGMAVLVLLDLSACFDTINHQALLIRLQNLYGIKGTALRWLSSYLKDRFQCIIINDKTSQPSPLQFGVPQGSVLGPKLYIMFTKPLGNLIRSHGLQYHMYADDTQVYITFKKDSSDQEHAINKLEDCLNSIKAWMDENMLKLNSDKTEVVLFSPRNCKQPGPTSLRVGDTSVRIESTSVRNLGVHFDKSMSMETHVSKTIRTCCMHIRSIGQLRKCLTDDATKSLIQGLVLSRLDYCNILLFGIPKNTLNKLQLIQNTAARIITKTKRYEHITPAMISLHWLPIQRRIEFKILLHVHKALNGSSPAYIRELIHLYTPARSLRSQDDTTISVPRTKTTCYGSRIFSASAARLWNSLPKHLRTMRNLNTFRKNLKTYLFKLEYGL
jgi:exonuclease III